MINWKSILSSFNDKPTLLEWLKLVEKALKESVLKTITTEQDADKANTKLIFNFEDGTQIDTGFFPTKGKDAAEITGATSMYLGTTNGLSKSRVTFSKSDNRSFYADILVKAGKAVESFSSAVKEVTDENTVNTITVNYDDKTSNTFEVSSARGKQGATGATGADGISITGIGVVGNEIVGDKTLTTLRANYSNSTSDEIVITAKNGITTTIPLFRKNVTINNGNNTCYFTTYERNGDKTVGRYTLRGVGFCIADAGVSLCSAIQLLNEVNTETALNARTIATNPATAESLLISFADSTATISVFEV